MAKQIINNTPADSGLGDNLKASMDKINANFTEVYNNVASISGATAITSTSDLINDGEDGVNPFITINDVPTTIAISGVTGLSTILDDIDTAITNLTNDTNANTADIVTINSALITMNGIINTQNGQISTINGQIADIYNIINNL
jgi:hypothetical protein